ncbi:DnaJ domain-containing protein [Acidocella aminolytica 101 = DSM 11237]|uniref:Heat shock protein DnaJ n=3 Tax=Acidocella TaxID=50709 RepID=A0A0D6PLS1_9PROT|nr:heat shock protein DnaJ [Acidocella aminolytica 101 = DSM 11237]SHF55617.1 DnaJ domain-containing protein [Acidocella aminolytica 101 = DSM 11237]
MPSDDKPQSRRRAYAPDPGATGQPCDRPGCELAGEYRAPKSRAALRDFHWFCLEHVREYNASWDYYKGMSADEIEAEARSDSSWQRPTWPLGQNGQAARMEEAVRAELHAFAFGTRPKKPQSQDTPPELREPLEVFGLTWPVTLDVVKTRYKELAKRHHPDANQGDRGAEETLKTINLAYAALRGKLAATARPEAQAATS